MKQPEQTSQRNLPYSTFLPTSVNSVPIQSSTSNHIVLPPTLDSNPQIQNNRLSYIGPNANTGNITSTVNLPSPTVNLSNGINSTYGTINNSIMAKRGPNGILSTDTGPSGFEQVRPAALVSSYISSLNNAVSFNA